MSQTYPETGFRAVMGVLCFGGWIQRSFALVENSSGARVMQHSISGIQFDPIWISPFLYPAEVEQNPFPDFVADSFAVLTTVAAFSIAPQHSTSIKNPFAIAECSCG